MAGILAIVPALALAAANPTGSGTAPPARPTTSASPATAPAVPAGDVLAQGGGQTLTSADVRKLVEGMSPSDRAALASNLSALEQLIRAQIVRNAALAEAKSKGFEHQPATQTQLERIRDEALVRLYVSAQALVPADYPSAAELQSAYDGN
jgi:peptidylprolyl isomerase